MATSAVAVSREIAVPLTNQQLGKHPTTNIINKKANELKYQDFPTYYSYQDKNWKRRCKPYYTDVIGRIANVHPNAGETFYLRYY